MLSVSQEVSLSALLCSALQLSVSVTIVITNLSKADFLKLVKQLVFNSLGQWYGRFVASYKYYE